MKKILNQKVGAVVLKNTVYLFEPRCKIGLDDVTKEQLGVWINSTEEDIKDLYIEEAYLGRKQNIKNIFCCGKQIYTFLWSEKHKKTNVLFYVFYSFYAFYVSVSFSFF